MTDETQFPLLWLCITAALAEVGGGNTLPRLWQLDTQIHHWECNSDLTYPGVTVSLQFMLPEIHCQTQSPITLGLHQAPLCSLSWNTNFCLYLSSAFGGKAGGPFPCFSPVYLNNLVPLANVILNNLLLPAHVNWKAKPLVSWPTFTYGQTKKGSMCFVPRIACPHGKHIGRIWKLSLFFTVQLRRNKKLVKPSVALIQGKIANIGNRLLLI